MQKLHLQYKAGRVKWELYYFAQIIGNGSQRRTGNAFQHRRSGRGKSHRYAP